MSNLNQCQFIGNLGSDPETRQTNNGKTVVSFSIGVTDKWKDKQTGSMNSSTEWVKVVAFDRLADIMAEYLRKGSQVFIQGKMVTRKWQDKNGNDRYTTEIVASQMQMLGGKGDAPKAPQEAPQPTPVGFDDFDDNIPF